MTPFFQHLPAFQSIFLTLLFIIPQVFISGRKVLATDCPSGTKPVAFNRGKLPFKTANGVSKIKTICAPTSSIGDTVFRDDNGNGIQDNHEPGVPHINITLTLPDGSTQTTTTDSHGKYSFSDLSPGTYQVRSDVPHGKVLTTRTNPFQINLESGQNLEHADFGFRPNTSTGGSSIGDTVFSDRNGNGVQDGGEPGIPNVVLTLTLPGTDGILGNGDDTTRTTTTNNNGIYNFNNLPDGNYRVTVNPPVNFPQITTGSPRIDVNLQTSQSLTNVDFGFRRSLGGSIGDFVFNDKNNDSLSNSGDIGLPNVQLTLKNANGQIVATTTTNSNGNYSFTGLPLGNYTVEVTQPNNFSPTTKTILSANLTEAEPDDNNVDFGFAAGNASSNGVSLQLVKRITAVLKTNGQRIQYNAFIDDPNDQNDNSIGITPLGQYELLKPLVSGDEIEYTIYFRAGQSLENLNVCDLIPAGTAYVNNSISVTGNGVDGNQGRFFSPLTSLEQVPESGVCENRNNPNGTVIVKLGNISSGQSGSVSFRVKIN
ncbi:SdrD B-like domain-containing protein [Calothrix sp. PCC 7507]|uniref:SdrD B-like domain-containing protein n=1 Tax=Calothrix sp. PCC 7507 TaxID=99598 RepID=UPI00029EDB85|nr:SdrD B-like domain-containing protein [Calothrix sp. PCC 7507]AFY35578.1 Cna B domain protein [Calothrix sp. PCC 7507]